MQTLIINLYGGPGCGKSTVAAGLFYELKCRGIECEMTGEYAKDKTWDNNLEVLDNQPFIFGQQLHRIWRLNNKVQFIVCDSPLLLSIIYSKEKSELFEQFIVEQYNKYTNINFVLDRTVKYDPIGRNQTEEEANQLDNYLINIMNKYSIDYNNISGDSKTKVNKILEYLNI
jgi:nicotinamide riboside kinase